MLQELSTRLSKAVQGKRLKQKLEQDLQAVETELQDKSARLELLRVQLEKEKVDVEKLERTSLTALFYSVLGSREQQLEKARQEMLLAQLQYQQMKRQVELLEQERNYLSRQLEPLRGIESEYEQLLSEKENLLRKSNQVVTNELIELSGQLANLSAEGKEITEAINAGREVILGLEGVIQSLESAENWGTWDLLGGGVISTAIKHSRIDEARNEVNEVEIKMSRFRRELADVQKNVHLQIEISELASFADFFFDGLITDWIVQSKIVDSLERSEEARNLVSEAVRELENLRTITERKNSDLQERRALLIART